MYKKKKDVSDEFRRRNCAWQGKKACRGSIEEWLFLMKEFRQQEEYVQFLEVRIKCLAEGARETEGGERGGT